MLCSNRGLRLKYASVFTYSEGNAEVKKSGFFNKVGFTEKTASRAVPADEIYTIKTHRGIIILIVKISPK